MTMLLDARPAHPVVSALSEACAGIGDAAESAIFGLADDELASVIGECEVLRAQTHHLLLSLVREADERNLGGRSGAASTAAWLTGRFRLQPRDGRRLVRLSHATGQMAEPMDYAANVGTGRSGRELVATGGALAAGAISPEHVAVVANVMGKIPAAVSIDEAAYAEEELAGFCRDFDPGTVARLGEHMLETLTEDTLDDEEGERHLRRNLSLDEKTGKIRGQLTRDQLAMLRTALDPLAAPNPAADGTPDLRTPGQRLADALAELARRAISADVFEKNHGMSHRVMVTIELDSLTNGHQHTDHTGPDSDRDSGDGIGDMGGPVPGFAQPSDDNDTADPGTTAGCVIPAGGGPTGSAELQWGSLISADAVRLIACHASIQRIVLDPAGAVLDVGREYRTVTPAQFAALIARDGGCAFVGCTRPPSWCVGHHIKHWADGGETNLDNLVLLCGHHHRVVHYEGWDVYIDPDDRLPTFVPPRWIDPDRMGRRARRPRPGMPRGVARRGFALPDR